MELVALSAALKARLRPDGLGLQAMGTVGAYNAVVPPPFGLPDLGSAAHAVLVIGHGKEVWAPFVRARRANAALRACSDPFDAWTSERISQAVAAIIPREISYELRFVWEGPPRMLAMQKLAVATGLTTLGPAGLTLDPVHGPWIAFRAALVVALVNTAPNVAVAAPCLSCAAKPCVAALARAQTPPEVSPHKGLDEIGHAVHVQPQWRQWLEVRDACPVGRAARYSDAQIRYHYARDARALDEEA